MRIAIVTGASSGLGRSFATKIAKTGDVDELWAIARREERLNSLKDEVNIAVRPLALDLRNEKSFDIIERILKEENPDVRYLVNAAGYGKFGNYDDLTRDESRGMIDINTRALMDMTLSVLPYMSRGSRLFQIGSSSAFQPLPGFNIYAATKAFVLSYTRSLRWELRGRGIRVTAVCPGWIKTDFLDIASETKNGDIVKHYWLALQPSFVVNSAMLGNKLGLAVVTCGPHTLIQRIGAKILPNWLAMGIWHLIR
jgi:short-subunit dehydrogenase